MADYETANEQLRKDNEDLRKQLGEMGIQLERLTTLLLEQRTNTTAGPSTAPPPEQQQAPQETPDPYGILQQPGQPQYVPPHPVPPVPQGRQTAPSPNSQPIHHDEHDSAPFDYQQTEEKLATIMNQLDSIQGIKRSNDQT